MTSLTLPGRKRWVSLAAFAVVVGLMVWLIVGPQGARVSDAGSSPEYSMQIVGGTGVPAGTQFTLQVFRDKVNLSDLDSDTTAGYGAVQIRLNSTSGLVLENRSSVEEFGPAGTPFWPDCGFRAGSKGTNTYLGTCIIGTETNESTYTGLIMEVDYTCGTLGVESQEQLSMIHGVPADTHLVNEIGGLVLSNGGVIGTIAVVCQASIGVGGIAELPDVAGTALEAGGSSGLNVGVLAGAVAGFAAGALVLGGAAWYTKRRLGP